MTEKDCTRQAKKAALEHGADLVGIVKVEDLPEHSERIERMLPGARCVLVIATGHSLASLRSGANELAQFDTIHTYSTGFPCGGPFSRIQGISLSRCSSIYSSRHG